MGNCGLEVCDNDFRRLGMFANGKGGGFAPTFNAVVLDANPNVGAGAGSASTNGERKAFVDRKGLDLDLHSVQAGDMFKKAEYLSRQIGGSGMIVSALN